MAPVPEATTFEKIAVIPHIFKSIGAGFVRLLLHPFTSTAKANTLFNDFVFSVFRSLLGGFSAGQEQTFFITPTATTYTEFVKANKSAPVTDVLPSGAKCHWIGPKTAEKVIFFCHGGGYVLGCSPGHLEWISEVRNDLEKEQDLSVAVVVLGYTLAPRGKYPVQLSEAVDALNWVINDLGKSPRNVSLVGDSAGGNLVLGIFSHILHPHPAVSTKLVLTEPLSSGVLISPWCSFDFTDKQFQRNMTSDYIAPETVTRWSKQFMGSAPADSYNQPALADDQWFQGLESVVSKLLVWSGGAEALLGGIDVTAEKLVKAHRATQYIEQRGAAHEAMIMDKVLGYKGKAEGTKVVESFMMTVW